MRDETICTAALDVRMLHETARLRAAMRRVEKAYALVMKRWGGNGWSQGAVERALDTLESDDNADFNELRQAQALLELLRAPVQLELISVSEGAQSDEPEQLAKVASDAGFFARFLDRPRRAPVGLEELSRLAWLSGWDQADQVLYEAAA